MLSTQNDTTTEIKNKGFLLLANMFIENGWHFIKNETECVCFTKQGFETEYFELKVDKTKIYVSLPIKNSVFQYKTSFKDYYTASVYVEDRFRDFII